MAKSNITIIIQHAFIKGFGKCYIASNFGAILNVKRKKVLKAHLDKDGYPIVYLSKKGKTVKRRIHRIVADLFVPGKTRLKNEVDHLDRDRGNYKARNLEWTTRQENMRRKKL